jgi:hypothetical protein
MNIIMFPRSKILERQGHKSRLKVVSLDRYWLGKGPEHLFIFF